MSSCIYKGMNGDVARWMRAVLAAAGLYNLAWGAFAVFFPLSAFELAGMTAPNYPELWQCIGMIVGVFGVGYLIAACDPFVHWPIVLVGLMGKVFGPMGFAWAVFNGRMPGSLGWAVLANDIIWWLPFALILHRAHEHALGQRRVSSPDVQRLALRAKTHMGVTLDELSRLSPVMLVFLRHAGCTFCREALADLATYRRQIKQGGTRVVLVHMGTEQQVAPILKHYGMHDVDRVSDQKQAVYRAFGLGRGRFLELFGPKVWWRGFQAGVLARHGVGRMVGDGFQMPGVFVVYHGQVIRSYRHQSAADRPAYLALAADEAYPQSGTVA